MKYLSVVLAVLLALTVCSCKSGSVLTDVKKDVWMHDTIPASECDGMMKVLGIYRRVKCTSQAEAKGLCKAGGTYEEFVSYCDKNIEKYFSMHEDQIKKWQQEIQSHCQ